MFDQNDQGQSGATTAPTVQSPAQNTTPLDLPDTTSQVTTSAPVNDSVVTSTPIPQDTTVSAPSPAPEPTIEAPTEPEKVEPAPVITPDLSMPAKPADDTPAISSDLMSIKKEALQNLTPLLDHLDQTPDEKFRTTMMLIQASDDQSLIQGAYKAAKEITDEKIRAQALLDIINEINYFSQNSEEKTATPA